MDFVIFWGVQATPMFEANGGLVNDNPQDMTTIKFDDKYSALDYLQNFYLSPVHAQVIGMHEAINIYEKYVREAVTEGKSTITTCIPGWWKRQVAN